MQVIIDRITAENNFYGVGAPTPQQVDKNLEIIAHLQKQMNQLQMLDQPH
jgi:hypothetical protein